MKRHPKTFSRAPRATFLHFLREKIDFSNSPARSARDNVQFLAFFLSERSVFACFGPLCVKMQFFEKIIKFTLCL